MAPLKILLNIKHPRLHEQHCGLLSKLEKADCILT